MSTMYDSVNVSALPAGGDAYAGYVGGHWPTYDAVVARFPGIPVLSIAVNDTEDAEALDIEHGDAVVAQASAWNARQRARGVTLPVNYTSVANVGSLLAPVPRSSIRLWTAHYTGAPHLCSPACFPGMPTTADATQWSDQGGAGTYDVSLLSTTFF
ncbi:MAG: hypothetical protein ACRDYZ_12485, partial [Acidimicrobiales bacterium]